MRLGLIFFAEAGLFFLLTLNYRACAKGLIYTTVVTDAVIAMINFSLIRWIADASTVAEQAVYIAGAVVGSSCGMWLTKHWKEKQE